MCGYLMALCLWGGEDGLKMCNMTSTGLHTRHCRAVVLAMERLSARVTVPEPQNEILGSATINKWPRTHKKSART